MHLALFAPSWPPGKSANGIVTYAHEVKKMMESNGWHVTVITSSAIYHYDGSIIEIDYSPPFILSKILSLIGKSGLNNRMFGRYIATSINRYCSNVDVFEMEESFGWVREVQSNLEIPTITRLHGPRFLTQFESLKSRDSKEFRRRVYNEGLAMRESKYISAPSEQVLIDSISKYNLSPCLTKSYPNPMSASNKCGWRFANCKKHQILHVGRFDRLKGADIIIEAFCQIAPDFPLANLIIVGPEIGIQDKAGEYLDFRKYIERNVAKQFHERLKFLGKLPSDDIEKLRQESHICVVPSRFENLPYSALEALAVGAPLLVADGLADNALVEDGETGWRARNGCPQSFADKLRVVFEMDDGIEAIAQGGSKFFMNHFAPSAVEAAALKFYNDVIADYQSR
jgi:glycosyltransferase involved in cell wall biosynthesis